MPAGRPYFVSSGLIAISGTSAVPMLYGTTTSTADVNIAAIRVACEAASGGTPPGNASLLFQLAVVTGSVGGGGGAITAAHTGTSTQAANTTFISGSTALTGLTKSTVIWEHPIALTAGSSWEDTFVPGEFERNFAVSVQFAVYYLAANGAGTSMNAKCTMDFLE